MPNVSRPSRACHPCRLRRLKCDLTRPDCGQCLRKGQSCPGYRDELELRFRRESVSSLQSKVANRAPGRTRHRQGDFSTLAESRPLTLPVIHSDVSTHQDQSQQIVKTHDAGKEFSANPSSQLRITSENFKPACTRPQTRLGPELSMQTPELLHHYLGYTSFTFATLTPEPFTLLWKGLFLEEAHRCVFLMHSVYALSALHRFSLSSNSDKYLKMAYTYHAKALGRFRSSVTQITKENATAILSFSFFEMILCIASPFILPTASDPLDSIYSLLVAVRGFWNLQPAVCTYLEDTVAVAWLRDQQTPQSHTQDIYILQLVKKLKIINKECGYTLEEKSICDTAIVFLQEFFATVSLRPLTWEALFTWPITLSDEFLRLVKKRHPVALIILVYWFVPVCRASDEWFLRRWDGKLIESIVRIIGPQWQFAIRGLLDYIKINLSWLPKDGIFHFPVSTFAENTEEEEMLGSTGSKTHDSDLDPTVKFPFGRFRNPLVDERLKSKSHDGILQ